MSSTFASISFFGNHCPCPLFQLANKPQGFKNRPQEILLEWLSDPKQETWKQEEPQLQVSLNTQNHRLSQHHTATTQLPYPASPCLMEGAPSL